MSAPHSPFLFYTKALSTTTCGLILGSTAWASVGVMPSLITAPISTYSKLAVFDGLIVRAEKILPPVFVTAAGSLAYLTYHYSTLPVSGSLVSSRESGIRYLVATGCMVGCLVLQGVVGPLNHGMQALVRKGKGKEDGGEEGNQKIGELLRWNWVRVGLSGIAFAIGIVEIAA